MSQKQGGKGKQSSQSDKNYWARIQARPGKTSARKARNIAKAGKLGGVVPDFPRLPVSRPVERMTMRRGLGDIPNQAGQPVHLIVCEGVTLDITTRPWAAAGVVDNIAPRLGYSHGVLNPLTGKQSPVSFRAPR